MKNFLKIISPFLLVSLFLGFFIRSYEFKERFMYAHDNDLASWMVKDIVFDHHLRLIGQLTSAPGIFIGPYYYYLLIPFYAFTGWDPVGSVWFSVITGCLAIISIYYVFYRLYGKLPANIGVFLYSVSWGIAGTEREVVPTTPVFLWCIWFFYSIHLLFRGDKKGLLYSFILMALVWHLNLALGLLFPLIIIAVVIHRKKYKVMDFVFPLISATILSLPLIFFETRHNFSQTRALLGTLFSMGSGHTDIFGKIGHVIYYSARNASWNMYWNPPFSDFIIPVILIISFIIFYIIRKYYERYSLFLYFFWFTIYVLFFTFNSINLSEYYLNGLMIISLVFATFLLSYLYGLHPITKIIVLGVLSLFLYINTQTFISFPYTKSGYLEKKALVNYIRSDSSLHGYPCISVSYITSPGNNFGYRYLFYLSHLHVNQPNSGSPVYTIVFPHSFVNRIDKSFGALGLILPDYSRYNSQAIKVSCSGQNANLTDPMFGFTN